MGERATLLPLHKIEGEPTREPPHLFVPIHRDQSWALNTGYRPVPLPDGRDVATGVSGEVRHVDATARGRRDRERDRLAGPSLLCA